MSLDIGNPDTDSICSAIAYANLKNQVEGNGYEAYRAGNINGETRYVLDTFGIKDPKYVSDVRPRLKDVNLNLVKGAKATDSLKSAREMMQTREDRVSSSIRWKENDRSGIHQ